MISFDVGFCHFAECGWSRAKEQDGSHEVRIALSAALRFLQMFVLSTVCVVVYQKIDRWRHHSNLADFRSNTFTELTVFFSSCKPCWKVQLEEEAK